MNESCGLTKSSKIGEVPDYISGILGNLNRLEDSVSRLSDITSPVCSEPTPTEANKQIDNIISCEISSRLSEALNRIVSITSHLNDICNRMQL